jgi:hypothetical protein
MEKTAGIYVQGEREDVQGCGLARRAMRLEALQRLTMRYTHTNFRFKEGGGRETQKFWRQHGDSVHQNAAIDPFGGGECVLKCHDAAPKVCVVSLDVPKIILTAYLTGGSQQLSDKISILVRSLRNARFGFSFGFAVWGFYRLIRFAILG